jgi:hypothetical protein
MTFPCARKCIDSFRAVARPWFRNDEFAERAIAEGVGMR